MSKYVSLRDNFTFDRFHYEGSVYELPDEKAVKYPKNFKLVEEPQTSISLMSPSVESVAIPKKEYKCSVCGKVVRTALGLSGHSRSHKRR